MPLQMKRKLIIVLASLVALAAGLTPVGTAIWLAYKTTVGKAEANLHAIAQTIAADTSQILLDIDQGLIALADLSYECTTDDINAMNTMAYDIPEISEIGLIRPDRKLVCTSWGPVSPPIKPGLPKPAGGFRLLGPMELKLRL
jgi:sensor c-di-GMP phosphodiesterase-like protein